MEASSKLHAPATLPPSLDDRGSRVPFPAGVGNIFIHHRVQISSGAHLASYPMGTGGSFPEGKADRTWSSLHTSI
jgi:hypothetical protein